MATHVANCTIRKGKGSVDADDKKNAKKRKASPTPDDPNQPPKKKNKPMTKVTKGRTKGPVDYDKQCGVINDKGLPCSRALTCKSHSMSAKRAVEGRSRKYDELLIEYQRANNPNFVEPVKRESKAEKKEKREKEKMEKKRQAEEAAAALGLDPKKAAQLAGTAKKSKKTAAAVRIVDVLGGDADENYDELDSDAEVDEMIKSVRIARERGVIGQPLAVPCDASSWFVQSRERARVCRDLLLGALGGTTTATSVPSSMGSLGVMGMAARPPTLTMTMTMVTPQRTV